MLWERQVKITDATKGASHEKQRAGSLPNPFWKISHARCIYRYMYTLQLVPYSCTITAVAWSKAEMGCQMPHTRVC